MIGQTHQKNLVRLIRFCKDEDQQLLASNGTLALADCLSGDVQPSWMAITLGIARGRLYLAECSTQIIHCDIKPSRTYLDDHHNARISDFGLAKPLV